MELVRELKAAGFTVDANQAFRRAFTTLPAREAVRSLFQIGAAAAVVIRADGSPCAPTVRPAAPEVTR